MKKVRRVKDKIDEIARLITKGLFPERLTKIGNRTYQNLYKYPPTAIRKYCRMAWNIDVDDLLRHSEKRLEYVDPYSSFIFMHDRYPGIIWDKRGDGKLCGGVTDINTVIQSAIDALGGKFGKIILKGLSFVRADCPAKVHFVGVGEVDWETPNDGADSLSGGFNAVIENIYVHENNEFKHVVIWTNQLGFFDRYYTNFPSLGGGIHPTKKPFFIFDGDVTTENSGYISGTCFRVGNTPWCIETTSEGRLRSRRLSDDKLGQNCGTASFNGDGVTTVFNIAHGLAVEPSYKNAVKASNITQDIEYVDANETNIIVAFEAAPPVGTGNVKINWEGKV